MAETIGSIPWEFWEDETGKEHLLSGQEFAGGSDDDQELSDRKGEFLAKQTDLLAKQVDWLRLEKQCGRQNSRYADRLRDIRQSDGDNNKTIDRLSHRWNKFNFCEEVLFDSIHAYAYPLERQQPASISEKELIQLAGESLLAVGKLTAEILDETSFALWLANEGRDPGDRALELVRLSVWNQIKFSFAIDYNDELEMDFKESCLGKSILAMHAIIRNTSWRPFSETETQILAYFPQEAAASSVCIWQAHVELIKNFFEDVQILSRPAMPKPGLNCGQPIAWRSASAEIF